jgi:S-adenosylmethionine hydrolase
MTVITLLTDFGLRDGYPGVMKGVIWKIAPHVQIADISHDVTPQDIAQAALLLGRIVPYFPDGTIHIAVIDPGVGTSRRGIAALIGSQYFVGPDNGIISMLLDKAEEHNLAIVLIQLNQTEYWMPEVSNVFHGRDIFASVAAHLANGIPLNALGTPISDPIRLEIPMPVQTTDGWLGQVMHIDHFGNISTNLHLGLLNQTKDTIVIIKGIEIFGLVSTFGERPPGTLIALSDSTNSLAISVVNGNAAQFLHASIGDKVEFLFR